MNDWLSEIEDFIETHQFSLPIRARTKRMARVLREQSAVLSRINPWGVCAKTSNSYRCYFCQTVVIDEEVDMLPGPFEFINEHKSDCVWRLLSDDAKELLD